MKYTIVALALAALAFTACSSKETAPAPKKAATGYSK
jgi:hypothetical protein